MVGCSAPYCSASTKKGDRLFRFPCDKDRCKKWIDNCSRDCWTPSNSSRLCEHHFESSQFEQHRKDGLKKLVPFAIPTIFIVPNTTKRIKSSRKIFKRKNQDEPFSHRSSLPSGAYDHSYAKRPKFSKDACIVDTDIAFSDNIAIAVDKPSSSTNVFCNHCNLLKLENRRLKNQDVRGSMYCTNWNQIVSTKHNFSSCCQRKADGWKFFQDVLENVSSQIQSKAWHIPNQENVWPVYFDMIYKIGFRIDQTVDLRNPEDEEKNES